MASRPAASVIAVTDQSIATVGAAATPACARFQVIQHWAEQKRACSRRGVNGVSHCAHSRTSATGYVTHARKAGGTARRGSRSPRGADTLDTRKVREWAKTEGIDIKERGRVPAEVIEKYKAAGA